MGRLSLTATRLRTILILSLFVVTILAAVIFYFADKSIQSFAVDVSHAAVDAKASQDNIQTLQKIQDQLINDKEVVDRANSIVADSKSYLYQDQIINDINGYASKAGVKITSITFSTTQQSAAAGAAPTASALPAPSGTKSTAASIALQNPVNYNSLLRFVKSVEQNLTKMQISKISLSKGTSGNDVTSDTLTIEVYVR